MGSILNVDTLHYNTFYSCFYNSCINGLIKGDVLNDDKYKI